MHGRAGVVAIGFLSLLLAGCHLTDAGDTGDEGGLAHTAPMSTTRADDAAGIETTLPEHIPPDALICLSPEIQPGTPLTVKVADPAAPIIVLTEPADWTTGTGEPLPLAGPGGLTGSVAVAATDLDPAAAFADYAATLRASHPDVQLEVGGAKFCGYSSQVLTGTFPGPVGPVGFADRITHIWTNTKKYLVTVHLEGPDGDPGLDAAKPVLMQQFTVTVP